MNIFVKELGLICQNLMKLSLTISKHKFEGQVQIEKGLEGTEDEVI